VHRHELNRLTVVREIDPGAIAQAAVAADIERLKIGLAHDREPALDRKAGILLAIQRTLRAVVRMHVVDVGIHDPTQSRLAVDLLDGEDVGVEEPHVAAYPVIIRGGAFHRRIGLEIGRLTILSMEVLQVPGGEPQPTTRMRGG
jgi:hypothetical protein